LSRGNSKISEPINRIAPAETSGPIMKTPANPQRLPAGGEQAKSTPKIIPKKYPTAAQMRIIAA